MLILQTQLNKSISRQDVEVLDSKGKIKRNLQNPIKKDTVMVPDGGYTIIRFKADNPGKDDNSFVIICILIHFVSVITSLY